MTTPIDATPTFRDPGRSVEDRVADLLDRMSLAEKVAQLSSVWLNASPESYAAFERGVEHVELDALAPHGIGGLTRPLGSGPLAVDVAARVIDDIQRWLVQRTRLGIPALVHEECLTGLMAPGAITMPSPLNWGAAFDPDLTAEIATCIRAQLVAAGVHQGLAPVLDVVRDQRYGRVEECIAEDAYLVATVGAAYIGGLQGPFGEVLACAKHFVGHGASEAGHNTGPVHVGPRQLRDVHLLPFEVAVQVGVGSVMSAYHDIDGVPASAAPALLTRVLRDELGFDGVVVSDYWAVDFLYASHRVAAGRRDAAVAALEAGVDFELPNPECYPALVDAVENGEIEEEVVDRSVARILAAKFRLGLFERFSPQGGDWRPAGAPAPDDVAAARAVARRAAEASISLLANREALLPIAATIEKLAVIGPNAASTEALCGNYAFANHVAYKFPDRDSASPAPANATIFEALQERAAAVGVEVRHEPGCAVSGGDDDEHAVRDAAAAAAWADVAVVVLGDQAGHLGRGTVGEGSDADDLRLPGRQQQLLEAVVATGTPTVLVHVAGRAHDLSWAADNVGAIVSCWFPGDEGARAVAAVLFGDVNPAGRCPVTFSRGAGQQPLSYDRRPLSRQHYGSSSSGMPVFCFGHGLSYTTFEYGDLCVPPVMSTDGTLELSCSVTNTGGRAGEEVVQLYTGRPVSSVVQPVQQLRGFQRLRLEPGERARVVFAVPADLLAYSGRDLRRVVEPGVLTVQIGASCEDIRLETTVELVGRPNRIGPWPRLRHRSAVDR